LLAALPTADFAGCGDREWRSAASDYSIKLLHFARRERSITFAMPSIGIDNVTRE